MIAARKSIAHRGLWFAGTLVATIVAASAAAYATAQAPAKPASLAADYGKLPLSFEANLGQSDARVKFQSRGSGYALFITDSSAVLSLSQQEPSCEGHGFSRAAEVPATG